MGKNITLKIESLPGKDDRFSEGLRMAVGYIIADNSVNVILPDWNGNMPDLKKAGLPDAMIHMNALFEFGIKVYALPGSSWHDDRVAGLTEEELKEMIRGSDVTIIW